MKQLLLSILLVSISLLVCNAMTLPQLISQFGGRVMGVKDAGYNDARMGYNYRYNRIPTIICQVSNNNDILLALEYAQSNNLNVSIRSGGHSSAMFGVLDDRVTIDVSQLKAITFNPADMTVTAQPGLKWVEFYNRTINTFGVLTPGGSCPSVGISGLSLGGGANDLATLYGYAVDNILELEVILANRTVVIANNQTNPDLFWALRGAGHGGFGIVSRITYKVYPARPTYYSAWITYNFTDIEPLLSFVDSFSKTMPNIINLYFTVFSSGPNKPVINLSCFSNGDPSSAEQYCGQFRSINNGTVTPLSFAVSNQSYYKTVQFGTDPRARRSFTKGSFLDSLSTKAIRRIAKQFDETPTSPFTYNTARLNLYWQGGEMLNQERDFNAFVHRSNAWNAVWLASYVSSSLEEEYHEWIDRAQQKMRIVSSGEVYQNYPDDELQDFAEAYYAENYPRLQSIKSQYDPNNYFNTLQSIKPEEVSY